jgi:multiple sugar transport system permease protein
MRRARAQKLGQPLLMLLPITLLALVLGLYPIGQGIYLGLTNYRIGGTFGIVPLRFLGLTNFYNILHDSDFTNGVRLICTIGGIVVGFTYTFGYLLALLLNRPFPLRRLFRIIVLMPMAIPPLVGGQVWRYLYDPSIGAVNAILIFFHLENSGEYLPADSTSGALWIAMVGIWLALPFSTLLILAALQSVAHELHEAAALDGAGVFRRFWHVTLPGTRGVLAVIIPLSFAGQLLAFDAYYVLSGEAGTSSFVIPTTYAYLFLTSGLLGRAAAVGDLVLLLILLIFWLSRFIDLRDW